MGWYHRPRNHAQRSASPHCRRALAQTEYGVCHYPRNVQSWLGTGTVRAKSDIWAKPDIWAKHAPKMKLFATFHLRWDAICSAVLRALYGADCYAYALVASGFGADLVIEVCTRAHCVGVSAISQLFWVGVVRTLSHTPARTVIRIHRQTWAYMTTAHLCR